MSLTHTSIHRLVAAAVMKKLKASPEKPIRRTGRRPKRSDKAPRIGEPKKIGYSERKRNHTKPKGLFGFRLGKNSNKMRKNGNHQANRHHVNQHSDHDETHSSWPHFGQCGRDLNRHGNWVSLCWWSGDPDHYFGARPQRYFSRIRLFLAFIWWGCIGIATNCCAVSRV